MWLERFLIIVPTLTSQRLATEPVIYFPTWVEWSILAGCVSLFILIYMVFTKLFPIVSIWEVSKGRQKKIGEFREWAKTNLPREGAELKKEL